MATADYWSSADLKALSGGGLINEDVMQKIHNISEIPLPFTERVGFGERATNAYTEWTTDALATPDITNAVIDGADATGNDASGGARVGNHCQQSDKVVIVTDRANASDVVGRAKESTYQLMERQKELMRDIEAIALTGQASVADNGDDTAGKAAGLAAWLKTNAFHGSTGATAGFQAGTKLVTATAPGVGRALLTDTYLKELIEDIYIQNGNPTFLMSVPQITRRLSAFTIANPTSMGIAAPTANVNGAGKGVDQVGQGFLNVIVTDFGFTLEIVPNRLQQTYADDNDDQVADLFVVDPSKVELAYLNAPSAKPLGRSGSAEKYQLVADWTLRVLDEKASGKITDLLPAGTIAAS